jgi:hypothetical protein
MTGLIRTSDLVFLDLGATFAAPLIAARDVRNKADMATTLSDVRFWG